jgi:hypothetical protein
VAKRVEQWAVAGGAPTAATAPGQVNERVLDAFEVVQLAIDVGDLRLGARLHRGGGRVWVEPQCEQLADLREREAELLRAFDEMQSIERLWTILPIA